MKQSNSENFHLSGVTGSTLVSLIVIGALGLTDVTDTDSVLWIYISYPISWAITAGVHLMCWFKARNKLKIHFETEKQAEIVTNL